jgi:hypothetical protein
MLRARNVLDKLSPIRAPGSLTGWKAGPTDSHRLSQTLTDSHRLLQALSDSCRLLIGLFQSPSDRCFCVKVRGVEDGDGDVGRFDEHGDFGAAEDDALGAGLGEVADDLHVAAT